MWKIIKDPTGSCSRISRMRAELPLGASDGNSVNTPILDPSAFRSEGFASDACSWVHGPRQWNFVVEGPNKGGLYITLIATGAFSVGGGYADQDILDVRERAEEAMPYTMTCVTWLQSNLPKLESGVACKCSDKLSQIG